jgi:hypothetical protein
LVDHAYPCSIDRSAKAGLCWAEEHVRTDGDLAATSLSWRAARVSDEVARHAKQRESRWNVLLLYLLAGLVTTSHAATSFIYPLNLNRLGHPFSLIGMTVALLGLGSLLSRIPGGAWYRLSRARLLICGALVTTGASAALLGVGDLWAFQACLGALHGSVGASRARFSWLC